MSDPVSRVRSPGCALAALRAATASGHAALDALLQLDAALTLSRLARVLQALECFQRPLSVALAAGLGPALAPWLAAGRQPALLRSDLQALGAHPLPPAAGLPPLDGLAEALGALYVSEGSALGGQVLVRRLQPLGLRPGHGASWFHGLGQPATAARWRGLQQLLVRHLDDDPVATARAVAAAGATFDALHAVCAEVLDACVPV